MSFSDHKITAFTHRIADLPDQPNLPADELKERFDSSPEELRQGLNAVCDDAARLEARVEGIVVDTFGDTIDKEMLSDELAAELDAKAVETSVASRITAEQTARASADTALDTRVETLEDALPEKAELYLGSYSGKSSPGYLEITLPFAPKAVLIFPNYEGKARMVTPTLNAITDDGYAAASLDGNVLSLGYDLVVTGSKQHHYIAIK